jgi:hypothetical protein
VDPFPIIAPRGPFPITTYYECMSIRFPLYANATNTYLSSVCKPIIICTYIFKIICTPITYSYIYSQTYVNHTYIVHNFSSREYITHTCQALKIHHKQSIHTCHYGNNTKERCPYLSKHSNTHNLHYASNNRPSRRKLQFG